jgi:hypothetical protein
LLEIKLEAPNVKNPNYQEAKIETALVIPILSFEPLAFIRKFM